MLKTKLNTETDSIVVQLLFEIWALCVIHSPFSADTD